MENNITAIAAELTTAYAAVPINMNVVESLESALLCEVRLKAKGTTTANATAVLVNDRCIGAYSVIASEHSTCTAYFRDGGYVVCKLEDATKTLMREENDVRSMELIMAQVVLVGAACAGFYYAVDGKMIRVFDRYGNTNLFESPQTAIEWLVVGIRGQNSIIASN